MTWWVHGVNRKTGYRSRVGPFPSVVEAAEWARDNRAPEQWMRVSITSRRTT